jgi:hypothetical protein
VPNCDPTNTAAPNNPNCPGHSYFVSTVDGSVANNGSFIGRTIDFQRINPSLIIPAVPPASLPPLSPPPPPPWTTRFYALDVPMNPPQAICPSTSAVSCGAVGSDNYRDNIACASTLPFSCGQIVNGGQVQVLPAAGTLDSRTRQGTRCLIHASNNGLCQDQDYFGANCADPVASNPLAITGGNNNLNPSLRGVTNISRSDSVVTVPLYNGASYDGAQFSSLPGPVLTATTPIVGFLQLGIMQTFPGSPATGFTPDI